MGILRVKGGILANGKSMQRLFPQVVEILEAQMNPKTKEAIANVLTDFEVEGLDHTEALAKICAIVDKEREGDVVVGSSTKQGWEFTEQPPKRKGRLIFVPD